MKGQVISINPKRGYIAVNTNDGISVVELLGAYDVEAGDGIFGLLNSLGSETLKNTTKQEDMDVYIQGVGCTLQNAQSLMK